MGRGAWQAKVHGVLRVGYDRSAQFLQQPEVVQMAVLVSASRGPLHPGVDTKRSKGGLSRTLGLWRLVLSMMMEKDRT